LSEEDGMAKVRKKNPRPQLGRKGRFLEVLVSLLERTLVNEAEITTPDWLRDRDTDELREVDIAIRTTVGSTRVLIVAECRDRNRPEDVRWIEELASKAVSVGAAKVIAISGSGFTAPACEKAQRLGVEVRELRDLTPATVADAFNLGGVSVFSPQMKLLAVGVFYTPRITPDGKLMMAFDELSDRKIYLPLFSRKHDGQKISLAAIAQEGIDVYSKRGRKLHAGIPRDGTHVQRGLTLSLQEEQVEVVFSDNSTAGVTTLSVILEMWYKTIELRPLVAHQYRKGDEALVETVEFGPDPAADGPGVLVTFHRNLSTGRWVIAQHQTEGAPGTATISFAEVMLADLTEPWQPWHGYSKAAEAAARHDDNPDCAGA
jgi:hypothetical protein